MNIKTNEPVDKPKQNKLKAADKPVHDYSEIRDFMRYGYQVYALLTEPCFGKLKAASYAELLNLLHTQYDDFYIRNTPGNMVRLQRLRTIKEQLSRGYPSIACMLSETEIAKLSAEETEQLQAVIYHANIFSNKIQNLDVLQPAMYTTNCMQQLIQMDIDEATAYILENFNSEGISNDKKIARMTELKTIKRNYLDMVASSPTTAERYTNYAMVEQTIQLETVEYYYWLNCPK